jgi:aspartyl-tRNA(Asn)/glutamyl-tRNA(Gln) amidotransferase subunit B
VDFGLEPYVASVLVSGAAGLADLFEEAVALGAEPGQVAKWLTGETNAYLNKHAATVGQTALTAAHLGELVSMQVDGRLSATAAKEVLTGVLDGEGTPEEVAAARDLIQVSDSGAIEEEVEAVLEANPDALEKIRAGDMKPFGFLVGQVMRATSGKADPKIVNEILRKRAAQ